MTNIAICDDDFFTREKISRLLKPLSLKFGKINCTYFRDGTEVCKFYEKACLQNYFDIIFMDIEMKSVNGINAAHFIRRFDKRALIIFITNHYHFAENATKCHLFRFLRKPICPTEFFKAFEDAYKTLKLRGKTFTYISNYQQTKILADDIIYFKTHRRQLRFYTINGASEPLWLKVSAVHNELKDYGFLRPHQSYLVNLRYVLKITKSGILLTDNKTMLPVSQRECKKAREKFIEHNLKTSGLMC